MSIALTNVRSEMVGTSRQVSGTITFDSSYPTGGELFPPSAISMYRFDTVLFEAASSSATTASVARWNGLQGASSKVQVYVGDNTNAAAAPSIERANTTDLSALVVRFVARGA